MLRARTTVVTGPLYSSCENDPGAGGNPPHRSGPIQHLVEIAAGQPRQLAGAVAGAPAPTTMNSALTVNGRCARIAVPG